jgi:hypothetical protein
MKRFPPVRVLESLITRADRAGMTPQEFIEWKNKQHASRPAREPVKNPVNPDMTKTAMWMELRRLQGVVDKVENALDVSEQRWRQHVQYLDKLTRNNPRARITFANHLTQLGVSHELA